MQQYLNCKFELIRLLTQHNKTRRFIGNLKTPRLSYNYYWQYFTWYLYVE